MSAAGPRFARLCFRLIPAAYREEVAGDLLAEYGSSIRPLRGRLYAGLWLVAHACRSAVAVRRHAPRPPRAPRDPGLLVDELRADWRLAMRSLRSSPLFVAVALVVVAVSIGLSTAVFSLVSGVLLDPLPYPAADRLLRLAEVPAEEAVSPAGGGKLAAVTVGQWKEQTTALEALVPYAAGRSQTVAIGGTHEQLMVAAVEPRFFDVIGAVPDAGRLLGAPDARADAAPVAVVSRRVWTQLLGQRREAIGGPISIAGVPHTVVGVAPGGVAFLSRDVDIWTAGRWTFPAPGVRSSFSFSYDVIARMRPGATVEEVRREGERVLRIIAMADPAFFDGTREIPALRVVPLRDDVVAATRPALHALFAGMALVLAAACVSLANLLVARNTARARDLAIRLTLGSSRLRLLRPLVFEHIALVAAGAAAGALLGRWILDALPSVVPASVPRLEGVRFDWRAFAGAVTVALVTALAVGLRGGWPRRDTDLRELSASQRLRGRRGSRSAEMARGVLVAAQVCLAVVLLVGAALIGRSLWHLLNTDPGYRPAGVLTFQVGSNPDVWRSPGQRIRFHDELVERIRALPDVTAVAIGSKLPLHPGGMSGTFSIPGAPTPSDPAERPRAHLIMVSADYHRALGVRLIAGRMLQPSDTADAEPVVVVDEALSRRAFGGRAVGARLSAIGSRPWTVVGVVESVKLGAVSSETEPVIYFPYRQIPEGLTFNRIGSAVVVRTASDASALVAALRELVRAMDPAVPIFNAMPLADRLNDTFEQPRFYTIALVLFASMALITAVLGMYGVQAYAVERRTAEFGVRRALGADQSHLVGLVMKRAVWLAAAGVAAGLPLAAVGAGLLRTLLFGVRPLDPATFVAVPAAVLVLALAASWQPARRALRVDPAAALRCE